MLHFERLTTHIGAMVTGADLTRPLDTQEVAEFEQALAQYGVLFFRDQQLTPSQQRDFAAAFGPLHGHPAYATVEGVPEVTILESTAEKPTLIEQWHSDMTFRAEPPLGTMLLARVIPETGGDTQWASMTAAFEGLSDAMQQRLSSLTAVHDFSYGFKESLTAPGGRERLADALAANPPVHHPLVIRHPVNGARAVFVNSLFTTRIEGMKPRESRALLDFLFSHVIEPEYVCRFRWSPGAMAFWDNRHTQHKPVNDYFPAHRLMHRITIQGSRPQAAGVSGAR